MSFIGFINRNHFFCRDLITGGSITKQYLQIQKFEKMPYRQAKEEQNKRLTEFLTYVQNNSAFYRGYKSLDLKDYPVMNKMSLIDHYDEVAVPYDSIPGQVGKLHIQSTSGSTGTPFKIAQDTLKRERRIAELKYFGKVVGFKSHEMLVHLRTWNKWQMKTPEQIKKERIIPFDIANMSHQRLAELCDTMRKYKAVCIRGYASSFGELANYVEQNPQNFPYLKIAIAGSEALTDDIRYRVKKNLGCEIIYQYADEECGILAQEAIPTTDKDNPMYFNNASYVFEVLKQDTDEPAEYGEIGRIVVTDLYNMAFPVIRYDTGDVGVLAKGSSKSNGWPILEKLYGRRFDMCYTTSGEAFSPMAVGRILKHFDWILQWQFIQKGQKEYELRLSFREDVGETELDNIIDTLKAQIGEDASLVINQVDEIPVLASGKRKVVVNEWKKN